MNRTFSQSTRHTAELRSPKPRDLAPSSGRIIQAISPSKQHSFPCIRKLGSDQKEPVNQHDWRVPMLSASSRLKFRRSATTVAQAVMTGARFTMMYFVFKVTSSSTSLKSRPPVALRVVRLRLLGEVGLCWVRARTRRVRMSQ